MARTRTYQVISNRIRYVCGNCNTKRSLPVPPNAKTRSIRCYKCGIRERCNLNRRRTYRESQSGKATMTLLSGKELAIDLFDISPGGVGLTVPPGGARSLSVNDEVHFKCGWNPRLFPAGRYIVKSINGNRIGIQNVSFRKL